MDFFNRLSGGKFAPALLVYDVTKIALFRLKCAFIVRLVLKNAVLLL